MEILLVIQILVVVAMIAVILVQKTSSDGFTTGGGSPNSFLTGRASANLFTHITAILAAIFILNSLVLAYMASHSERASSVLDQAAQEVDKAKLDKTAPASANTATTKESGAEKVEQPVSTKDEPQGTEKTEQPVKQEENKPSVPAAE